LNQAERAVYELRTRADAVLSRDERGGTSARDGFPASSLGGAGAASVLHCFDHGKDNCPCGNNEPVDVSTDSTGNAATSEPTPDEVARVARGIVEHLDQAVKHLQSAVSMVALGEHLANPDRRASAPEHCQACGRLVYCTTADPIRSGYCDACRKAWGRYSDAERAEGREPDRVKFQALRAKEKAA
jgi:hypothetical protein